jgi:hypothetical protein
MGCNMGVIRGVQWGVAWGCKWGEMGCFPLRNLGQGQVLNPITYRSPCRVL